MHGKQSRENRWNGVGSLQLEPSELDDERDENTAEHWNWTLRRVARRGESEGVGGKWYLDGTRFSRPVYARLRGTEQVPFPKNPPPRPTDSGGEQRGASQSECLERRLGFELAAVIGWI
ncbi:hypothetical protein CISG_07348 [Coccidioides immitis RMSCC 3703]|uniref:Uncharacterized protein n=1 Tax=Coccidioides immitis RMSCC 3703 TaxID=454286 RepID=A0A0J8R2Q0_COCIT|nr:hypothetical protein CISG_07348 [Coccidioides immitis RMSCC 3703]